MKLYLSKISELIEKYDADHKYASLTCNRIKKTGVLKRQNELKATELLFSRVLDLSTLTFSVSKNGKPYVNELGIKFSYSHSQDLLALLITKDIDVGVDVQFISSQAQKVSRAYLNDDELKYAKDDFSYTLLWTIKESIIKKFDSFLFKMKSVTISSIKKIKDEFISSCKFEDETIIVRSKFVDDSIISYTSKDKIDITYID